MPDSFAAGRSSLLEPYHDTLSNPECAGGRPAAIGEQTRALSLLNALG